MLPNATIEETPVFQTIRDGFCSGYIRGWPVTVSRKVMKSLGDSPTCVFIRPETVSDANKIFSYFDNKKGKTGSKLCFSKFDTHRTLVRQVTYIRYHNITAGMIQPVQPSMAGLPIGHEVSAWYDTRNYEDDPFLQGLFLTGGELPTNTHPIQSHPIPPLYDYPEVLWLNRRISILEWVPGMRVEMRIERLATGKIKVRLRNKLYDLTNHPKIRAKVDPYLPNILRLHKLRDLTNHVLNFVVSNSRYPQLVLVGHNQGNPYWENLHKLSHDLDIQTHPVLYSTYDERVEMPTDLQFATEGSSSFGIRQRIQKAIILLGGEKAYYILRPHTGIVSYESVRNLQFSRFNSAEIQDIHLKHLILQIREPHV